MLETADYAVIAVYVVLCVVLGVWAGRKQQVSPDDYFLAGRSANPAVVAIGLVSGLTSGISFLGSPGFTSANGVGAITSAVGVAISIPLITFITVPFFCGLGCTTAYEYLELRFSKLLRTVAAVLFLIRVLLYLAIVLFAPALALSAVTKLSQTAVILVCGFLATAYTMKGGMNAVIWTDFMQSIILVGGAFVVLVLCCMKVEGGILQSQYLRLTDFTVLGVHNMRDNSLPFYIVGTAVYNWAQAGADQIAVQRYLTTADLRTCQATCLAGGVLNLFTMALLYVLGIALYAFYQTHSNPHLPKEQDQLLPFFFANELPQGLAGLLLSGVLGCTMSVFSSGLNAATTCFITDIWQNMMSRRSTSAGSGGVIVMSRWVTFATGMFAIGTSLAISQMGQGLVQLSLSALGLTGGPVLGLYLLGMLSSRTNYQGASIGFLSSIVAMFYLAAGQKVCEIKSGCELLAKACHNDRPDVCVTGWLALASVNVWILSPILMTITLLIGYASSLAFPRPGERGLTGLCFGFRGGERAEQPVGGKRGSRAPSMQGGADPLGGADQEGTMVDAPLLGGLDSESSAAPVVRPT